MLYILVRVSNEKTQYEETMFDKQNIQRTKTKPVDTRWHSKSNRIVIERLCVDKSKVPTDK